MQNAGEIFTESENLRDSQNEKQGWRTGIQTKKRIGGKKDRKRDFVVRTEKFFTEDHEN
jgi:hypothetical protein